MRHTSIFHELNKSFPFLPTPNSFQQGTLVLILLSDFLFKAADTVILLGDAKANLNDAKL